MSDILPRLFYANGKLYFAEDPNIFDAAIVEIERLRAEADTINNSWRDQFDLLRTECDKLEAEIERLQAVLLAIADHDDPDEMSAMARRALEEK
jgi:hypothetical protein